MYKSITLQLTTQCSLKCPYCFAPHRSSQSISVGDFEYFCMFCRQTMPDSIHLTGGEPSMHSNFSEIVKSLLEISPVTVYSNLTIPKVWDVIDVFVPANLTVLVNLNNRKIYSDELWEIFHRNLSILIALHCRIVISHTFFNDKFESEFDSVLDFMQTHNISNLRISQYVDNRSDMIGMNINQVQDFYDYIAENIDEWQLKGLNIFFDCAVPPCYIKHGTFNKLYNLGVLGTKCCPKAFVLWDLSVTHCYTTLDCVPRKHLMDFTLIEDIIANSSQVLNNKLKYEDIFSCSVCALGTSFCNCPDYHLLNEKRSHDKLVYLNK